MQNINRRGIKEVKIEDKVIMIEMQSVTPLFTIAFAHPAGSKWYWQLNKFSAWNHASLSMPSSSISPHTEVLNNYITFQRLIWLRAIILLP